MRNTLITAKIQWIYWCLDGGADRNRTCDLLIANETLYQLSYDPIQFTDNEFRNKPSLPRSCSPVRLLVVDDHLVDRTTME